MKIPIHFGYGLTVDEADVLLNVLCEKGWIADYGTASARLEYRTRKKVLNVGIMLCGICCCITFVCLFFVKKEYLRSLDIMTVIFPTLLLLSVFCFVMAIISFFWNKKEKKRTA